MTQARTVVKAIILNENNKVLLLKIGVHLTRPDRSHTYDFPGGFVDEDESGRRAIVREIAEETGIKLERNVMKLVYGLTDYNQVEDVSVVHLLYMAKLSSTPSVAVSHEHEAYEWVSLDSVLKTHELRPRFVTFIEHVKKLRIV